jgi:hypothetical protein
MYYWNPKKIKELKEKGYKLKFYNSKELLENESNRELVDTQGKESDDPQKE